MSNNENLKPLVIELFAALARIRPMAGAPHDYTIGDVWQAQQQAADALAKARELLADDLT